MKGFRLFLTCLLLVSSGNMFSEKLNTNNDVSEMQDKLILTKGDKGVLNSIIDFLGGALSVAEDVACSLLYPVQELIKQKQSAIVNNPYKNLHAHVRCGEPVCEPERLFRDRRLFKVKEAQEKMLDMPLENEDVLEIALSCSGGGWRAMCCSIGSCVGANKIGLLDCSMYVSALSGSTWFLGPWLSTGLSIDEYKQRALGIACKGIEPDKFSDIPPIINNLWVKFAYNQPLNIVDLYGSLLSNSILKDLGKDCHQVYLTDQRRTIESANFPMPVYTATLGEREKSEFWFEFTPYEVGSRWMGAYVPSWAFGRSFKGGVSKDNAPEQSLGFLMGVCGSAFAADFEDVYDIILEGVEFPSFLKDVPFAETIFNAIKSVFGKLAYATDLGDLRIAWSRVRNFTYGMKGVVHSNYRDLKLVDAGLDFNNPIFATYRKPPYGSAPDIVFIFDSSGTIEYKDIKRLVDYADYNGLKFPRIEPFEPGKQIINIFKDDEDLDVPVVVYLPRVNGISLLQKSHNKKWYDYYFGLLNEFDIDEAISSGFANTFNFSYSKRQAEQLMAATEFNMIAVSDVIKDVMKKRIEAKRVARNKK